MQPEDEAFVDDHVDDDLEEAGYNNSEDEVEGDDLMENMEQDYEANSRLDQYEAVGLDDLGDQQELSLGQRLEVDRQLDQQERV